MEGDERDRSFKVQDRRRFTDTGDTREDVATAGEASAKDPAEAPAAENKQSARPEPDLTFASFVIGLITQALVDLGEVPHPADGATHTDLPAARQVIDILAILRDKTRGNLDPTESTLIESALYDLRMKYVERSRHG